MTDERWEIDTGHSGINFSVRHMVISKVRGRFGRWSGSLLAPDGDLQRASAEVVIDASSIDTGVADRDTHLKSADFFDTARYPEIRFVGHGSEKRGAALQLKGELSMHGVTRPVELELEYGGRANDPWGHERAAFTAKISIDRKEFGLAWNQLLEAGGVMVGDRVDVEIEVEAVKQS